MTYLPLVLLGLLTLLLVGIVYKQHRDKMRNLSNYRDDDSN